MPTSESKKALRQYRRDNGLCVQCGDPADNGSRCSACSLRDSKNRKRYAARDRDLGICANTGCNNPTTNGKHYCDKCSIKSAVRTAKRRSRRVISGMCSHCGDKPLDGDKIRCIDCHNRMLAALAILSDARDAEGLCRKCGKAKRLAGFMSCQICLDNGSILHAARKMEILQAYGGPICVGCQETEVLLLQIDHIAGGGWKHSKIMGGSGKLYIWLRDNDYPPGFRVLCANCNVRAHRGLPFPNPLPSAILEPSAAELKTYKQILRDKLFPDQKKKRIQAAARVAAAKAKRSK